jgi:hypothetical protein
MQLALPVLRLSEYTPAVMHRREMITAAANKTNPLFILAFLLRIFLDNISSLSRPKTLSFRYQPASAGRPPAQAINAQ